VDARHVIPTVCQANVLVIHVANTNWFDGVSQMESPAGVDWRSTHPVLRYVGFDTCTSAKASR